MPEWRKCSHTVDRSAGCDALQWVWCRNDKRLSTSTGLLFSHILVMGAITFH